MYFGGWTIAPVQAGMLPEKVATAFGDLTSSEKMIGAGYMPLLYCGSQLVNGTNHMLICKQTLSDADKTEHIVNMVLHQPNGEMVGKGWSILSIETII